MNIYLITILLFISVILTFAIRKLALKKNVIDIPNERSSHTTPTPRGGGLAIVVCWYIGISYLFFSQQLEKDLYHALLSGIFLAIVSVIDDIISLNPKVRLIVQSVTAIGALYFLKGLNLFEIQSDYPVLSIIFSGIVVIGMIWFINLYNFLDGIDAYASLEAVFIAMGLFLFTGSSINLVLIAATAGFLFWNWPKAKIFMGDVGSTQLGFILVVLGIYFHNCGEFNIFYWLTLSSLFWFDASFTLFRRWRNKEKLSQPHKKHAYQRIVQAGFSHLKTNIYALCINLTLLSFVGISLYLEVLPYYALAVNLFLLLFVNKFIDRKKPFYK